MTRSLEHDATEVWTACHEIRHGTNYGRKLTEAGALTSVVNHHPNACLRYIAHEAREMVVRTLEHGPEAA